jgi:hypothetical protein
MITMNISHDLTLKICADLINLQQYSEYTSLKHALPSLIHVTVTVALILVKHPTANHTRSSGREGLTEV